VSVRMGGSSVSTCLECLNVWCMHSADHYALVGTKNVRELTHPYVG